jgi:hypothetical protein
MILTAENGWSFGEFGYGEDKKKALREALNEFLAEEGKEPVDWSAEDERSPSSPAPIGDPGSSPSRWSRATSRDQDKPGPRVRRV